MNLFIFVPVCVFQLGVSGFDTHRVWVFVMAGDSVTMNTNVKTNQQEKIKWFFNNTRIAQISDYLSKTCTDVQCNEGTERFRDRLKLENQTGSLTIMNTINTDSGEYKLQIISSNRISEEIFIITVDVPDTVRDQMKTESLKEGESVTLSEPGVINYPNNLMRWYFNGIHIAEITGDQSKICADVQCEERFRDRLKLNQTGSLTIMNTRTTDSGEYRLEIIANSSSIHRQHSIRIIGENSINWLVYALAIGAVCVLLLVAVVTGVCRRKLASPKVSRFPTLNSRTVL